MTREEFIAKLPQNNDSRVETILQMIDEGISILGINSDDGIKRWYQENYERLEPDIRFFFYLTRFVLAHKYTEKRCEKTGAYGGYRLHKENLYEYIFDEACRIRNQINDFLKNFSSIYNYDLISVDDRIISGIAIKYYYYYDFRSQELDRMISECKDEMAFIELLGGSNSSEKKNINGLRVYLSRNKKKYVDISSNYANELFSDVILNYFYDLFRYNPRDLNGLRSRVESLEISKKKLVHRTIHEMYSVFADNGYLEYNNSIDHYKLGSKNGKYVSTNNNVSRWVYAVFSMLSGEFDPDSLDMDKKKRIRDCLKAYAKERFYHQDDFKSSFDFEKAYSAFTYGRDSGIGFDELLKLRIW